jgi:hypothetical protein
MMNAVMSSVRWRVVAVVVIGAVAPPAGISPPAATRGLLRDPVRVFWRPLPRRREVLNGAGASSVFFPPTLPLVWYSLC